MRKKIVAGNWKMNLSSEEGRLLIQEITDRMPAMLDHQKVIFCTPFTHLSKAQTAINKSSTSILLGAQNCNPNASGAFTGEISISMLKEMDVKAVIIGHSERRQYFKEDHDFLKQKVDALVAENMLVLFCCGEPLNIREAGKENEYVAQQLMDSLYHLTADQMQANIVIAYEPIWAIGTGVTASTQQAQDMHAFIRKTLSEKYGEDTAQAITILYGGSCNASNAKELFACADVDGGLIGGAALKADTFLPIIEAMA